MVPGVSQICTLGSLFSTDIIVLPQVNKASSEKGLTWSRLLGLVNFSSHQKLFVVVGIVGIVWSPS